MNATNGEAIQLGFELWPFTLADERKRPILILLRNLYVNVNMTLSGNVHQRDSISCLVTRYCGLHPSAQPQLDTYTLLVTSPPLAVSLESLSGQPLDLLLSRLSNKNWEKYFPFKFASRVWIPGPEAQTGLTSQDRLVSAGWLAHSGTILALSRSTQCF